MSEPEPAAMETRRYLIVDEDGLVIGHCECSTWPDEWAKFDAEPEPAFEVQPGVIARRVRVTSIECQPYRARLTDAVATDLRDRPDVVVAMDAAECATRVEARGQRVAAREA